MFKLSRKPKPRLMRKAHKGDSIVFKADSDGCSAYYSHLGHTGKVTNVEIMSTSHRKTVRAVYTIECECRSILHPRGTEFDVLPWMVIQE